MILTFILYWFAAFHAIYVSVTEIEWNDDQGSVEIRTKVFTDDLESGIYHLIGESVTLTSDDGLKDSGELIAQYLRDRVDININGEQVIPALIKAENQGDATWCYFILKDINGIASITIQNQILTELFDTQSNVVTVDIGGEKKYLRFSKSSEPQEIRFD